MSGILADARLDSDIMSRRTRNYLHSSSGVTRCRFRHMSAARDSSVSSASELFPDGQPQRGEITRTFGRNRRMSRRTAGVRASVTSRDVTRRPDKWERTPSFPTIPRSLAAGTNGKPQLRVRASQTMARHAESVECPAQPWYVGAKTKNERDETNRNFDQRFSHSQWHEPPP